MNILYITENNTRCYGVTFENKGWIKGQKFDDNTGNENIIYKVNPDETFLGKSEWCEMTSFSGAFDKSVFDGNTILLEISEENDKHRFVHIGGNMICSFLTNDKIYKYISNMGSNITPFSIAIGWEIINFLTPHFRFVEKEKIDYDDGVELLDYYVSNCWIHSFKKLRTCKITSKND